MTRVGERYDPWHHAEPNYAGGHMVYSHHPDIKYGPGYYEHLRNDPPALTQKGSQFTDYVNDKDLGLDLRIGEHYDDWHRKEVNFKGGHLVYKIDPEMSGFAPDPANPTALSQSEL